MVLFTLHTALRRLFWFWGSSASGQLLPWKPSWKLAALRERLSNHVINCELRPQLASADLGQGLLRKIVYPPPGRANESRKGCKKTKAGGKDCLPVQVHLEFWIHRCGLRGDMVSDRFFFFLLWWALATRPYNCSSRAKSKWIWLARQQVFTEGSGVWTGIDLKIQWVHCQ